MPAAVASTRALATSTRSPSSSALAAGSGTGEVMRHTLAMSALGLVLARYRPSAITRRDRAQRNYVRFATFARLERPTAGGGAELGISRPRRKVEHAASGRSA